MRQAEDLQCYIERLMLNKKLQGYFDKLSNPACFTKRHLPV